MDSVFALVIPLAVTYVGVGAAIPHAQSGLITLNLSAQGVGAGLFFFIQMAGGALYSSIIEALHLRTIAPIAVAIGTPALVLLAVTLTRLGLDRRRSADSASDVTSRREPQPVR